MKRSLLVPGRKLMTLMVLFAFVARMVTPAAAAPAPIKLVNWGGTINYVPGGITGFTLEGSGSHLGQFTSYGEVDLVPGTGRADGVVVMKAANGDLLVGVTFWEQIGDDPNQAAIHFSWRDSIELSDGTVVNSTGRFASAENRPPGLVVIAIIAILIALLLPAVQK